MKNVILFLLLISCSSGGVKPLADKKELSEKTPPKPVFEYEVQDIDVFNGKIKYVSAHTDLKNGAYKVQCKSANKIKSHSAQVKDKEIHFYFGESYFSAPHQQKCFIEGKHFLNVNVKAFNYKKEKLNVPKRKVDLSKKDLERVIREKEIKKKIYLNSAKYYMFDSAFKIPLKSKITSVYGNQRLFNNKKKSQHLGNDLRAAVGVPIKANNRGRVVFTGDLFFSGNMVVIDHGLDLYTVYMHLSKVLVQEGTVVNQGDIVGKAGMTGRVSGPHLHWGVRLNGEWMDGFTLVNESKKQFSLNELEE